MRRLALGVAGVIALVATPAFARDGAVYVGAELGAMKANDTDIDVGTVPGAVALNYRFDLPQHAGWDAAGFIGYDFGGFRLEAEYSKKRARIESVSTLVNFPLGQKPGTYAAEGHTDVTSYMLNGMVDVGHGDTSFFAGGGVGYASVQLAGLRTFSNASPYLQDTDSGFAWQLFAGVRQALSDNVDVHLKYRYFNAGSIDLNDGTRSGSMDFSSHSVLGGISFNFGGHAPVVPPPVAVPAPYTPPPSPPPPPAPPAMRTCPDGTQVMATQSCPVPPPPVVPRAGERG